MLQIDYSPIAVGHLVDVVQSGSRLDLYVVEAGIHHGNHHDNPSL